MLVAKQAKEQNNADCLDQLEPEQRLGWTPRVGNPLRPDSMALCDTFPEFTIRERRRNPFLHLLSFAMHARRMPRLDSVKAWELLRHFQEEHPGDLDMQAVTGRHRHLHRLTRHQLAVYNLQANGLDVLQNPGGSSSAWKAHVVRGRVQAGTRVVFFENDPRAAREMALPYSQGEQESPVTVYLLRTLAARQWVLRLAGITLPPNVVVVPTLEQAARHILAQHEY